MLFVDDQPDLRELIELYARKFVMPFDPVFAECVEGALRAVRERRPEAVVLDINLSGETGMDVAEHLHEFYPDVLKAALTAYDMTTTHANCEEYGMQVWPKPVKSMPELIRRVVGLLNSRPVASSIGTNFPRVMAAMLGLFSGFHIPRLY
ncbi:MAG: response regulator [Pyrinomonadaceae bacterium]